MPQPTITVAVRVPAPLYERLRAAAAAAGVSMARYVSDVLDRELPAADQARRSA